MNKNQIMKTDILDIIFENRNKAYGAYDLRKFYPGRLKLALGFMFVIAIAFSAFTLMPKQAKQAGEIVYNIPDPKFNVVEIEVIEPDQKQPVIKSQNPVNQKILTSRIEIVDKKLETDMVNTILPTDRIGTRNIDIVKPGIDIVQPDIIGNNTGIIEKNIPQIDVTLPMDMDAVDEQPAYPGGMDALKQFLERHLHNPYDLENGETVNVRIKFVVGYNGKLKSFVTVLDGGEIYNKEVVRVLQKMPDWIPGKAKGEQVSVYYTIPVKFIMTN